jgi:hypothetical protein
VSINFYPDRTRMAREVGLCITLKRREVLESFCGSCVFRVVENAAMRECPDCEVRQAMGVIGQEGKRSMTLKSPASPECEAAGSAPRGRKEITRTGVDFLSRLLNYSKALLVPVLLLCAILPGSASFSFAATPSVNVLSGHSGSSNDRMKILSVLEDRTTDRTVLDKAADKLDTMDARRLRILSSLCDRITGDSHSAGADIAFSLMTVMIVLS